jgi:anaphase-promoting complex subunit 5
MTPSQIALLCLIELYTDDVVPPSSTIPILSFILNQILPLAQQNPPRKDLPFILNLDSFETLLSAHPSASGVPGRSLWDLFLQKLWELDSFHELHVFFSDPSNDCPKPRFVLSRTSPCGSFVRRARVEFERLRFSETHALWAAFVEWRHETRTYWARKSGMLARWAGDSALNDGGCEWGAEATEMLHLIAYEAPSFPDTSREISIGDVEKLLEFQVEQMQSRSWRPPSELYS